MAPPSFAIPHPQWKSDDLFSKLPKVFPPMLPPPMPPPLPPYLYNNLRNTGFAWPILPRIPRAQHSCRPKKIINIRDPQTGQDITEEILSSVGTTKKNTLRKVPPPIRPHNFRRNVASSPMQIPLGFVRKAPSPNHIITKCNHEPEYFWPDEGRQWNDNGVSQSFLGSCSWPSDENKAVGFEIPSRKRCQSTPGSQKNIVKYNREVLLSLRYHPLSMAKPNSLPDLDVFKKEIQCQEKADKLCHYGTQTSMVKPMRFLGDKSRVSTPKTKPKPRASAKAKCTTAPKLNTLEPYNDNKKQISQKDKSLVKMDRGDSRELEDITQMLDNLFI